MRRTLLAVVLPIALLVAPATAGARTIHVHPGDSIQAAVNSADPGDTVLVHAGTYKLRGHSCPTEEGHKCGVLIRDDRIRLVGKRTRHRRVVLKPKGDVDEAIAVVGSKKPTCVNKRGQRLHGSLIKGFSIKNFEDDGVFLYCVDHYRVTGVRATGNNEYGIFPSHSVSGRVDHSLASGSNDTGIYIGQSRRGRVDHNTARKNVSGFEIENSSKIRADHNLATGNTAGFLSFALSGLDVKTNHDNRIDHNRSRNNNKQNTCVDPSDTVCKVPRGTGMLLLAVDKNRIENNRISGNDSYGIGLVSYCIGLRLSAADCAAIDIDPNPDGNRTTKNRVQGNGGHPYLPPGFDVFAKDLAWDTMGKDNCWSKNVFGASFPASLPACK
jgi:parallel beta-helix repeat protein